MLLAAGDAAHTMLLTMVTALAAGVFLIVIARRLAIPGIVLLLAGGVLLGPSGLGIVQPDELGGRLGEVGAQAGTLQVELLERKPLEVLLLAVERGREPRLQPVDARTDIYSLCATLYELLTLKPVFEPRAL